MMFLGVHQGPKWRIKKLTRLQGMLIYFYSVYIYIHLYPYISIQCVCAYIYIYISNLCLPKTFHPIQPQLIPPKKNTKKKRRVFPLGESRRYLHGHIQVLGHGTQAKASTTAQLHHTTSLAVGLTGHDVTSVLKKKNVFPKNVVMLLLNLGNVCSFQQS